MKNNPILRSFLLIVFFLTAAPAQAGLCLNNSQILTKLGLNSVSAGSSTVTFSLPVREESGSHQFRNIQYEIYHQKIEGRITRFVATDDTGHTGRPHEAIRWRLSTGSVMTFPRFGTLTRAQVFIQLEGEDPHYGLVMLNFSNCIESNRAMFETLLHAFDTNQLVSLGLVKARLRNVVVDVEESEGEIIRSDIELQGGLIQSVATTRSSLLSRAFEWVFPLF